MMHGLAFAAALLAAPVAAMERSHVALLSGWAEPGGGRVAGLSITLAPGWKTYWRAPGEAGLPPAFDWSASANLADVTVEWPAPSVFESYGMTTLGYGDAVVLPLRLTPVDSGAPIALRLAMDYGVCADVCVPARAELSLDIAPGAPAEGALAISAHRARLPAPASAAGVEVERCIVVGAGRDRAFEARLVYAAAPASAPHVVVEGPEGVWFSPAAALLDGATLDVAARAEVWGGSGWIARDDVTLTLIDAGGGAAVEIAGCSAPRG